MTNQAAPPNFKLNIPTTTSTLIHPTKDTANTTFEIMNYFELIKPLATIAVNSGVNNDDSNNLVAFVSKRNCIRNILKCFYCNLKMMEPVSGSCLQSPNHLQSD